MRILQVFIRKSIFRCKEIILKFLVVFKEFCDVPAKLFVSENVLLLSNIVVMNPLATQSSFIIKSINDAKK